MPIPVYFKEAWTCNTRYYLIEPNWTTLQLSIFLKNKILVDFEIDHYEIVEAGQNIEGLPSESAPALNISNNILLNNLFDNLSNTAFYIRRISDSSRNTNLIEENSECVICFTENETYNYFGCRHNLCNHCFGQCITISHNRCPICRQNLTNI